MHVTQPASARRFEIELELAAPREEVWRAIATAEGLSSWFSAEAEVEPYVGGRMAWDWGEAYHWPLTIDVWEPGKRLVARHDSAVDDNSDAAGGKLPLFVEFILEGDGGQTVLRLVHSGFGAEADFDEEYDGISQGWPVELQSLKLYLECHRGERRQLAWARVSTSLSPVEAMKRLLGDEGIAFSSNRDLGSLRAGDRFSARLAENAALELVATSSPGATGLAGSSPELNNAFFHAHSYHHPEHQVTHVWLWLAQYGAPEERVQRYRASMEATLARLFARAVAPVGASA